MADDRCPGVFSKVVAGLHTAARGLRRAGLVSFRGSPPFPCAIIPILASLAYAGDPPTRQTARQQAIQFLEAEVNNMAVETTWVSTDGNLSGSGSWSPSVPVGGDSWIFSGSSDFDVVSNLAAFNVTETDKIWFKRDYDGDVGSDGNALDVPVRSLIHQGAGSVFYKYNTPTGLYNYILVDSPNLQDAFIFTSGGNTKCSVFVKRGQAKFLDGAGPLSRLIVGGDPLGRARVSIGSSFGNVTYFHQNGGFVTTKSDLGISTGDCTVSGGTLVYDALSSDAWARLVVDGGNVIYNGTGTLTEGILKGGILDMTHDGRAKTITTLIILPGATFLAHPAITVTTLIDLRESVPTFP